jgi:hypothetical protein
MESEKNEGRDINLFVPENQHINCFGTSQQIASILFELFTLLRYIMPLIDTPIPKQKWSDHES